MDFFLTQLTTTINDPLLFLCISFIALLFLGEPVILAIALFSATNNLVPFPTLIILAIVTAVIAESFWFFVGTYFAHSHTKKNTRFSRGFIELEAFVKKTKVRKPLPLLIVTRPFTGLTIIAILFLGQQNIPYSKFLLYSLAVNIFWTPIVAGAGYAAGKGYTLALTIFEGVHTGFGTLIFVLVFAYLVYNTVTRRLVDTSLPTSEEI